MRCRRGVSLGAGVGRREPTFSSVPVVSLRVDVQGWARPQSQLAYPKCSPRLFAEGTDHFSASMAPPESSADCSLSPRFVCSPWLWSMVFTDYVSLPKTLGG